MTDTQQRLTAALADRYRVERELGAGGMATVYLAHDLRHERDVAIKVLHPDLGAALGAERFLAEIKTTAKLQHPHILPLLDSGAADGLLFYVMPYVRGETLRDRLTRETQLPVADALRIAREVGDALSTAHEAGVVHRDIKPENILLQGGHALVADFGISLAVQQVGGARMTQTGLSLGTPQYMSPEQAMGDKNVDHRADQYALGAVVYEMLASEPPHTGTNPQAIVAKLLTEAVRPVTVLRPAVPASVEAALHTALQKLPADRFPSVAEFVAALQGTGTSQLTQATAIAGAAPRTAGARRGLIAAGITLAALAAGGGWLVGRAPASNAPTSGLPQIEIPIEAPPGMNDVANGFYAIAVSDDGRMIAFNGADSTGDALYLRNLVDGSVRKIGAAGASNVAFSPDGSRFAYGNLSNGTVEVASLSGVGRPAVSGRFLSRGIVWLDDSTLVVGRAAPVRIDLTSGTVDSILPRRSDGALYSVTGRATDTHVLAIVTSVTGAEGELVVISVRDSTMHPLGLKAESAMMAPGGWLIYRTEQTVFAQQLDTREWKVRGSRRLVVPTGGTGRLFKISPSGVLLTMRGASGADREIMIVDRRGRATVAFPERRSYLNPRFSPDGRRLSFAVAIRASAGGDAWVADLASGAASRVTTDSAIVNPEWFPGADALVLSRLRRGNERPAIMRVPVAGGESPAPLLVRADPIYETQWSSDGRTVIWREDRAGTGRDIFTMRDGDSTTIRALHATSFNERGLALAPDGNWYAYVSDESGRDEVYVSRLDRPGQRWPVSRAGGVEPRWARNGELFFRNLDSMLVTRVTPAEPAPGVATPTLVFTGDYVAQGFEPRWDVSPDGQRFAMVRLPEGRSALKLSVIVGWLEALARGTER